VKKGGSNLKTAPTNIVETSYEDKGTKQGRNWKEPWIVNLIYLKGIMHEEERLVSMFIEVYEVLIFILIF